MQTFLPIITPIPLWKRLVALFYDLLLLISLCATTVLVLSFFETWLQFQTYPQTRAIVLWSVGAGYYGWCWSKGHQSLGMKAWRLGIERIDGQRLTLPSAILRYGLGCLGVGLALVTYPKLGKNSAFWLLIDYLPYPFLRRTLADVLGKTRFRVVAKSLKV
jgi:uncharacterized RDD family membrane protein YckC